jgi:hypothetical protein
MMQTSILRTACEREEAWLRLVDEVERCFVARLYGVSKCVNLMMGDLRINIIKVVDRIDRDGGEVGNEDLSRVILSYGEFRSLRVDVFR